MASARCKRSCSEGPRPPAAYTGLSRKQLLSTDFYSQSDATWTLVNRKEVPGSAYNGERCCEQRATDSGPSHEHPCIAQSDWVLLPGWDGDKSHPVTPASSIVCSGTIPSHPASPASSMACSGTVVSVSLASDVSDIKPGAISPNVVAKTATWAHPCDSPAAPVQSRLSANEILSSQAVHKLAKLREAEQALSSCERQLSEFENGEVENGAPACHGLLLDEIVAIAAEALECGCSRDVPGAMDVFEQANAAVERVAGLLEQENTSPRDSSVAPKSQTIEGECGCLIGLLRIIEQFANTDEKDCPVSEKGTDPSAAKISEHLGHALTDIDNVGVCIGRV